MSIRQVKWTNETLLACADCSAPDNAVVLCVDPAIVAPKLCPEQEEDQPFDYSTIDASIVSVCQTTQVCPPAWAYVFAYDDEQLLEGETLTPDKIFNAFCKGCLGKWVEELVGDEVHVRVDGDEAVLVSQHGCEYSIPSPIPPEPQEPLLVEDTETVDLTINPDVPQTLTADVKISADEGNEITAHADGIYAPTPEPGAEQEPLLVQDTDSVDLTINPDIPQTLSADVKISADADNEIEIRDDGLYAPAAGEGGAIDWHILGNTGTVDGTNFCGTIDNVAFDVRTNNIRIRRSEPNAVCGNIIDGGPDASVGPITGVTIGGGGFDVTYGFNPHTIDAGYFSTIGGGSGNLMIPDATPADGFGAGYSTIGGGVDNIIEMDVLPWASQDGNNFQGRNTIGGGNGNLIIASDYNTIGGGFFNQTLYQTDIDQTEFAADSYIWGDTIAGGLSNQILGDNNSVDQLTLPNQLGANFIGGGEQNEITSAHYSAICGGGGNFIETLDPVVLFPDDIQYKGWSEGCFIGGGLSHFIQTAQRSGILSGGTNTLQGEDSSTIVGGFLNRIYSSTPAPLLADQVNPHDPTNTTGSGNIILGGLSNQLVDTRCSTILGGAFLKLGSHSCGFQAASTRDFTNLNGGDRDITNTGNVPGSKGRIEPVQVDLSAFSNIHYFGDLDVWIANTNGTATKLKFFEPNTDLDFSSANYSSFEAQAQSADIIYKLPSAAGTAGQSLKISSVAGTTVTLVWG